MKILSKQDAPGAKVNFQCRKENTKPKDRSLTERKKISLKQIERALFERQMC